MTPESFVERFESLPSLLGSVLMFKSKMTRQRNIKVTTRLRKGVVVPAASLLRWHAVSWLPEIASVAMRNEYAAQFDEEDEYGDATYPIIDKGYDLVFRLHDAGHTHVMSMLYLSHHDWSDSAQAESDQQVAYILEGHGYFRSSVMYKFTVGKRLFESEQLDECDEAIIAGSLAMVSDRRSFLALKASAGY